jgi:hypothetical protein
MQQRRLRLGDILDDYCPRERRITNHVVVALIEDEVKQTRCSTCDADHEYKQAKAPASRRRKPAAALAGDLQDAPRPRPVAAMRPDTPTALDDTLPEPADDLEVPFDPMAAADEADADAAALGPDALEPLEAAGLVEDGDGGDDGLDDDGPVHRRLIRATLPRPEGQLPERKEPDFTIRNGRAIDGNRSNGHRHQRGQRQQKHAPGSQGGGRFGQPRQGSGQGQRFGFGQQGSGQGQRHGGNRQGPGGGQRSGRPGGPGRGPGQGQGQGQGRGPKRGR